MKGFFIFLVSYLLIIENFAQPVINSFNPSSGPVGTTVILQGTGFSSIPTNNFVFFGTVKAAIIAATETSLQVTVPGGTTFKPITVTTNNLTAYSVNPFIVTFPGNNNLFVSTSFIPKTDLVAGIYPHSISLADFNNDGRNDLLVSRGSSNTVSVFQNNSTGENVSFALKLDFAAKGNHHEGSATGDLDGDGKIDFVITNSTDLHSISIFRNISSVTQIDFESRIDISADNAPYSVAIGDLNNDGKPDLAVGNNGSIKVSIYLNRSTPGTILFENKIDFPVGSRPYGIAINDLDGDGKADLAVTSQGDNSGIFILRNISSASTISFSNPVIYTAAGLFTITTGDLDEDGKPEVVAAHAAANSIVILKNNSLPGNITFSSREKIPTGNYPVCVSIADLNGDGKPDLVSSNRFANQVSAIKNTSTPGILTFNEPAHYDTDVQPIFVATGDLNGDNRPELIAANSATATVSILTNLIGTNLAPSINSFTPASGINSSIVTIKGTNFTSATTVKFGGIAASSFMVNSATEITAQVGTGESGEVSVTTGYGTASLGGFVFNGPIINSFTPVVGVTGTPVTITGTNFTGATDVKFGGTAASSFTVNSPTSITAIVGAGSSGNLTVSTANGLATLPGFGYGAPTISSFTPTAAPIGAVITIRGTNFNPVAANNTVFFGSVKATISAASSTHLQVIVPAGAAYHSISVTTNNLIAYSNQFFTLTFPSDGSELSPYSFSTSTNYRTGTYPFAVAIADFNNDGKPDIVTANSTGDNISILKNNSTPGSIHFLPQSDISTNNDPKRLAIGDLNGDGKLDMVVSNFNSGNASTISVFRNTSTGGAITFALKSDFITGNGSIGVGLADLNLDGKLDIIVSSGNSGFFSIFQNTTASVETVSFAAKKDYNLLHHPDDIVLADLDKDGRLDIITSNFSNTTISAFRNTSTNGNISLALRTDYLTGKNPTYLTAADYDGDNSPDIAVSNYSSGSISFFKNSNNGAVSLNAKQDYNLLTSNIVNADLNGDGKPDLITGRRISGFISIIANKYPGTGSFSFGPKLDFSTGNYDTYVAAGDLDGDGKPELVAANTMLNNVTILHNRHAEPEITDCSALTSVKGSLISLTGSNLGQATAVKFGGTPAQSFTVVSPTKINAVISGGASGAITVSTPFGTASFNGFTFIPEVGATEPLSFCSGGTVTLTSTAATNNQWYKNAVAITNGNTNSLVVNTAGHYTVETTSNGISSTSTITEVTVTSPSTPVITVDSNNNLVSSASSGNQWYLNGVLITEAIGQLYRPVLDGNYTVKTTINGCESLFSEPKKFPFPNAVDMSKEEFLNIFPIPTCNDIFVNWNLAGVSFLTIDISDLKGSQIIIGRSVHSGIPTNLSFLSSGVYILKVYDSNKIYRTIKIVKL